MDQKMRRICTICARGGSKEIVNKNLRLLSDKPLLAYPILQAKATGIFSTIAVSSDSDKILETAKDFGADQLVKRPDTLATDKAAKLPAIQHCVREVERRLEVEFDVIVDLDATAPLRLPEDIRGAVELLERKKVSNVITGVAARRSPYFNLVELDENGVVCPSKKSEKPIVRRQDTPPCFDMNASIYVWWHSTLMNCDSIFQKDTSLYIMPKERSFDIDDEIDFEIVEYLANKRGSYGDFL